MSTVDTEKIRALMAARGLDVTSLAAFAGMSRQGLHRMLRPGYEPLPRGFVSLADALGVTPESLLTTSGEKRGENIYSLLEQAAAGEPRAFEVLPVMLAGLPARTRDGFTFHRSLDHQLIAAAGEVAAGLQKSPSLSRFVGWHAAKCDHGRAFFFSHRLMNFERIMAVTPLAMKKHLVFGAFNSDDFERHFSSC